MNGGLCGYPELYDTTSYFYRNRNKFCNETGAACRSPPPMTRIHVCCVVYFTRIKRISCANEANFTRE